MRNIDSSSTTVLTNGDISVCKTRFGLMAYHERDTVIGRSIKLYGEWAPGEIRFLQQFIEPGDWVIDAGANIGAHTIPFAKFVGSDGKVFAYEPQRVPYQLLCANAVLNNLYNIYALNLGLGRKPATVRVPFYLEGNIGNIGANHWGVGDPVQIVTIDTFAFPAIKLIKIDVEGMERDVIEGAVQTIRKSRPYIFLENNVEEKSAQLIQMLLDLGYRCWWFFEPYYNPDNYYGFHENIFTMVRRPQINMFCIHRDRKQDINNLTEITGAEDKWQDAYAKNL